MPDALQAAVIGYGLAGEVFHASLIDATPGMDVAVIVTSDPHRQARAAARFPTARVLPAADQALDAAAGIDLAVIASPNRTHVPLALQAVDAGIATVVDKPLAATVADAVRLRDAAAARGVPVTVFQNRRWDGDFLTVRDLLRRDVLGTVHRSESRFERWRPDVAAGAWRESSDAADAGGVTFDLGSHLVDQALTLFGPVASVYAELRAVRPGARVDDDAFVALTHTGGVISHLWMSMVAASEGPRLRVLGSAAAYVKFGLDGQERQLRAGMEADDAGFGVEPETAWGRVVVGDESTPVPTERGGYRRYYELVATALRSGAPMPVTLDDAIATLTVLEAARASAAAGAPQRLASNTI